MSVVALAVTGSFVHVSVASAAAWHVVSSPNPGATGDQLYSASVIPGTSKLWAVGRFENNPSPWAILTQLYNGSSWTTVASDTSATRNDTLYGVSATSATNAWAVGDEDSAALIEHWNGSAWTRTSSATPGTLYGTLAVSSTSAWAVGGNVAPQIEHWTGAGWQAVPNPASSRAGQLFAVTRIPNTNQLWAVGQSSAGLGYRTLIERWDGTKWAIIPSPNPTITDYEHDYLTGVAASSRTNAWAIGYYVDSAGAQFSYSEHWNGKVWTVVSMPNPGNVNGNGATLPRAIARVPGTATFWVVGEYATASQYVPLAERWNGTWTVVTTPGISGSASLNGVVATSRGNAWAVGNLPGPNNTTLIEHYH